MRAGWENIPELFEGFNGWAWVLVVNNGCMGIALSAVIFYTDSIIRLFVEGSSLMLTAVFTIIVFGLLPSVMFAVSFFIIVGSFLVFYQRQFLAQSNLMGQIRHMVTPFFVVVAVAGLVGIARVRACVSACVRACSFVRSFGRSVGRSVLAVECESIDPSQRKAACCQCLAGPLPAFLRFVHSSLRVRSLDCRY